MKTYPIILTGILAIMTTAAYAQTQDVELVKWQQGPSIGNLSDTAQVHIPAGYIFAGANDTRILMKAMQNPTSGREMGFIAPVGIEWFVVFEFDDIGYVRDDEKSSLDPEAMLESIKKGTEASNKERTKNGWPTMTIIGWEQKPEYNETTHNLEWAIIGQSQGKDIINYNTRILGRGGVMRVTLVTDPTMLSPTLPKFKNVLAGYEFKKGRKYAEFRQGDKMAKYGLTALVVGGATAVAMKSGMFKWIWKGLLFGFLAIVGFIKKLFSRNNHQG